VYCIEPKGRGYHQDQAQAGTEPEIGSCDVSINEISVMGVSGISLLRSHATISCRTASTVMMLGTIWGFA